MASVNCYLPDALKARAQRELPATVSFSELLRESLVAALEREKSRTKSAAA